jgi:MerR family transcriptional regulator, light-induced transcriptional regulator
MAVRAESRYREYVEALVGGQRQTCSRILRDELRGGAPFQSIYIDFIQSSLYEVGERWERNELSVATEHLASSITQHLLNEIFAAMVPAAPVGRSVIVAAFAPELHRIGARIVADLFELGGWDSHFVAGETLSGQLRDALAVRKPDLVAVSLTNQSLCDIFVQKLAELRRAYPALEVVIGGQALGDLGSSLAARDPLLTYVASLEGLAQFLSDKLGAARPVLREPPPA